MTHSDYNFLTVSGSQETLVNLAALIVNLSVLPLVSGNVHTIWILFFIMTLLHLFSNYMAVKSLVFKTLNKDRLLVLLSDYNKTKIVNTPEKINATESPFLWFGKDEKLYCNRKIKIGVSLKPYLQQCLDSDGEKGVSRLLTQLQTDNYVIFKDEKYLYIALSSKSNSRDILKAYCHAVHSAQSNQDDIFDFEKLDKELNASGWITSHGLQITNEGWKVYLV